MKPKYRTKHIYWFSYYNLEGPSTRYRAKYALDHLEKHYGITYSLVYPGYGFKTITKFIYIFLSILFLRKYNSLIVFQRIHSRGIYANALKVLLYLHKKNTLYDLDDADYLINPEVTIAHFMKHCETCTLGSRSLVDYASQFNDNIQLSTSPVISHMQKKGKRNEILTIGWIGYYDSLKNTSWSSHKESLQQLFYPAIMEIEFSIKLVLLGVQQEESTRELKTYFENNPNVTLDIPLNIDWQDEEGVYGVIKTFDIGLSPLLDNEANRAKSAFKLKQYLSCGVPVLGSNVGENERFLMDGINGYICNTPQEYKVAINKIKRLEDIEYERLGDNALNSVVDFSLANYCHTLLKAAQTEPAMYTSTAHVNTTG